MKDFRSWCASHIKGISIYDDINAIDKNGDKIKLESSDPFFPRGTYIVCLETKRLCIILTPR